MLVLLQMTYTFFAMYTVRLLDKMNSETKARLGECSDKMCLLLGILHLVRAQTRTSTN